MKFSLLHIVLWAVLILLLVILVGSIGYYQSNTKQKSGTTYSPTIIPSPEDQNSRILKDIQKSGVTCSLKNVDGADTKDMCRIEKVVGNFAKGTMPMAYWMAILVNNSWKVVVTGNGIPQCSEIDAYAFPKEIYGNCIEKSGDLRHQ